MNQLNTAAETMLFFQTKKQQRRTIPVDTKPVVVHFNPIYEQFDNHQQVHNQIVRDANCVRIRVKTWPEFINAIREEQPDFLTIHQSVIDLEHHTLKEFSATIQSLVTYLPKHRRHNELLPVAIGIDKNTTYNFVRQLKKLGFTGIWPTATAFGPEVCVEAMRQFMSNKEFWPASIVNQLPNRPPRPYHIYFRSDAHTFVPAEIKKKTAEKMPFIERVYCETWSEIADAIEQGARQMVIDYNILKHLNLTIVQILKMVDTQAKLHDTTMAVMVGIGPETPQSLVSELKKTPVLGVSPSAVHWGPDETALAARALTDRQPYWPEHIIGQLPNPKKKPVQVYFRSPNSQDVTKIDPDLIAKYNSIMPVDFVVCDDWSELGVVLTNEPHQIAIHANVFQLTDSATIGETINMLQTQLKLAKLDIPLAIVVERTTPQSIVLQAKRLGMQGIVPYHCDWPQEDILPALMALTNRVSHWPEHIISQLPDTPARPVHILFRSDVGAYITPAMKDDFNKMLNLELNFCSNWEQLADAIAAGAEQMVVHTGMLEHLNTTATQIIEMINTRASLDGQTMAIMVGIEPTTPLSFVRELKKTSILGICPSAAYWGTEETSRAVQALTNRQSYWPRHIIDQLPSAKKPVPASTNNNTNGIKLTGRQQEVADLICRRGLSNKQIAKTLSLSESTVKIHVSAVLKSFGVRNRTQLALSAGNGLKA